MERQRLTITLRKDLLPTIDAVIDGAKIRNRSHAIEYLLNQSLFPKIKKAFILAGGKGVKMRPFTYEMPKTMLPVRGRPLLEHTIELLRKNDIRDIIILVGHLGHKIKEHFKDGDVFGVNITYLEEKGDIGTAGALFLAKKYLKDSPFLMIYGDVLIKIDLHDFSNFHQEAGGVASLALTSLADPSSFGVVELKGNRIVGFREKPPKSHGLSRLIGAGFYLIEPTIFSYLPSSRQAMLEKDVFPRLAEEDKLYGYPFGGQWYDVGTPEIYARVIKEWDK